jgi:hypothetical protein
MRWLLKDRRWERTILAVIAAAVIFQVFCEPIVGTADNRDYWRVTNQVGIGYRDSPDPTFFRNFQRDYVIVPEQPVKYLTSELLLARIALHINDVVSKDGLFDIRMMGFVHSAAYLAAIALLLAAFRRRKPWIRVAVGVASILIFTDVRLVAYFNSFYCEPAQLIFLITTIGFALHTADESRPRRQRFMLYAAFLVSTALFLFAKTQDLVFAFPLAVVAFRLFPSEAPRWRVRAAVAAAVVALFVWGMKSDAYEVTHQVNINITLDEEILPHSKTPDADLQELGDGDRANITFGSITVFYLHHPWRWWKVARRRLHEAFTRTPYGNFEKPLAGESQAFDEFSSWKTKNYPRSMWFWIIATSLYLGALGAKWRMGGREDRSLALTNAAWVVGCVLQFIAVVTFEANGTEKHFFIFNVLVDLVFVMSIVEIDAVVAMWRRRRSDRVATPIAVAEESQGVVASLEAEGVSPHC